MTDRGTPNEAELIAAAFASKLLDVWVAMPGVVESYDPAKRTITVQPAVRRPIEDEDGRLTQESPALVQAVPFAFPGGAKLTMRWNPQKGDTVLLVYLDYSAALFRQRKALSDTPDARKHGPAYPVAVPWALVPADGDDDESIGIPDGQRLHFTSNTIEAGDGDDFVAMAQKVAADLAALQSILAALATGLGANPTVETAAAAAGAALTTALGAWPNPLGVASSNLKADL